MIGHGARAPLRLLMVDDDPGLSGYEMKHEMKGWGLFRKNDGGDHSNGPAN
jgi:hypothetical protein